MYFLFIEVGAPIKKGHLISPPSLLFVILKTLAPLPAETVMHQHLLHSPPHFYPTSSQACRMKTVSFPGNALNPSLPTTKGVHHFHPFLPALSLETRPGQNQICNAFLCCKNTVHNVGTQLLYNHHPFRWVIRIFTTFSNPWKVLLTLNCNFFRICLLFPTSFKWTTIFDII